MLKMNKNGAMQLTRGDSAEFQITIADYPVASGDKVYFTVKDCFAKEINATSNVVDVIILPSDTVNKNAGVYMYDVEYKRADGNIYTITEPNVFVLQEDITKHVPAPVVEDEGDEEDDE